MDDKVITGVYEAPQVVDYGDLQELTAGCLGATGGDAYSKAHGIGGGYVGVSVPTGPFKCHSEP
jgi:hypothetical protein